MADPGIGLVPEGDFVAAWQASDHSHDSTYRGGDYIPNTLGDPDWDLRFGIPSQDSGFKDPASDLGDDWEPRVSVDPGAGELEPRWEDVVWSPELGIFCAIPDIVGSTRPLMSMTSSDGITWTGHTMSPFENVNPRAIAWSPSLGLFAVTCVASSTETTNPIILTSPDGENWTVRYRVSNNGNKGFNGHGIIWIPELGLFSTIEDTSSADNDHQRSITSTDGVTWTKTGGGLVGDPIPRHRSSTRGMAWSSSLGVLIIAARNGTGVARSTDGKLWSNRQFSTGIAGAAVAWSPTLSRYVVKRSQNKFGDPSPSFSHSGASLQWFPGVGKFFYVGRGIEQQTSPDGDTWTHTDGTAVRVGVLQVSSDGDNWTSRPNASQAQEMRGVAYSPSLDRLVTVSLNGRGHAVGVSPILTSKRFRMENSSFASTLRNNDSTDPRFPDVGEGKFITNHLVRFYSYGHPFANSGFIAGVKSGTFSGSQGWMMRHTEDGRLAGQVSDGTTQVEVTSPGTLPRDVDVLCSLSYDGKLLKLYIDEVEVASVDASGVGDITNPFTQFRIGTFGALAGDFTWVAGNYSVSPPRHLRFPYAQPALTSDPTLLSPSLLRRDIFEFEKVLNTRLTYRHPFDGDDVDFTRLARILDEMGQAVGVDIPHRYPVLNDDPTKVDFDKLRANFRAIEDAAR